jgi:hypothetical protein
MGSPCDEHEDCAAGHACVVYRCVRRCESHADCPRESACVHGATPLGICLLPCVPARAEAECSPGRCRPLSNGSGAFGFPQLFFCSDAPLEGSLPEGAFCEEASDAEPAVNCAAPGACFQERGLPFGTGRCRDTCALDESGNVTHECTRSDRTCRPAFPHDPRPSLPGRARLGICSPTEAP